MPSKPWIVTCQKVSFSAGSRVGGLGVYRGTTGAACCKDTIDERFC